MERSILQEYAVQADCLVAQRRRQVAHQHEIVSELECAGRNSQEARKLLREFEACLVLQVADQVRLRRHLGLESEQPLKTSRGLRWPLTDTRLKPRLNE